MHPSRANPAWTPRSQAALRVLWAVVAFYVLIWGRRGMFVSYLVATAIGEFLLGPMVRGRLAQPTISRRILALVLAVMLATVIGIVILCLRFLVGIRDE